MSDTDHSLKLPIRTACGILKVAKSQYYDWRQMQLLGAREDSLRMSEREGTHVAVLHLLCTRLGPSSGRIAFRQIRDELANTIGLRFEIVWCEDHRLARLVHSDVELAEAARIESAVLVIRPENELVRVTNAWHAEADDRRHNTNSVKRARGRKASKAV